MSTTTSTTSPTLAQSRSGGGSCTSSNKVTLASQPAAGDLIVIYAQLNNTSVKLTAPSGFSTKDTKTANWFQSAEYYKIATGTEGTTYSVGSTCSGSAITWVVADIKGENQSNPFDQHNTTVNSTTGTSTFSTASLTPSHSNDLPVSVIAPGSNGLTVSSISPSNWTLGATGAYYTQKLYSGPVTGTSAIRFSETTSSASKWASQETLDLINPANTTATTSTSGSTSGTTSVQTSAAPVVAQARSGGGSCTSSNKVTLGSQPAAGDLIAIYAQLNNTSVKLTAPSGFSTKDAKTANWFQSAEYYKIASGTEGTTFSIGSTCSGNAITWVVADIKGENQSYPFDQHNTTVNSTTGTSTFSSASLTPSHSNDLPVSVIAPGSNGLTVSSISPSNWSLGATGAYYTQKLYSGPATGTSAIRFSETTSSASKWASQETLDLINPASATTTTTSTPTPAPVSASSPTPAPTATPVAVASSSGGTYTYKGCKVYGPNDWFTTNLMTGGSSYVSNTVDPNSAKMINNFIGAYGAVKFNINGSSTSVHLQYGPVNVASSSTPLHTVQKLSYGFANDQWNDDPNKQIPWQSTFYSQGACTYSNGDCHSVVITPASGYPAGTHPCVDYETYNYGAPSYSSSTNTFTAESLTVHNLNYPYNSQYQEQPGPTKAGLPVLGTVDIGEDASLSSINHIAMLVLPGTDGSTNTGNCSTESCAAGGYVTPANAGTTCVAYCTNKIPFGARLRLNPSKYTCPSASTNPQAHKICVQLETYGAIVTDHGSPAGTFGMPLGPSSNDTNPWNSSDVGALDGIPLTDFDIMTVGTIH